MKGMTFTPARFVLELLKNTNFGTIGKELILGRLKPDSKNQSQIAAVDLGGTLDLRSAVNFCDVSIFIREKEYIKAFEKAYHVLSVLDSYDKEYMEANLRYTGILVNETPSYIERDDLGSPLNIFRVDVGIVMELSAEYAGNRLSKF